MKMIFGENNQKLISIFEENFTKHFKTIQKNI